MNRKSIISKITNHINITFLILLLMGFQAMFFAVVADLLAINRRLLEDVQYNLKKG